jgi:hypothetical protein
MPSSPPSRAGLCHRTRTLIKARSDQAWRNIPLFVAVYLGIWVGYYIMFDGYQFREQTINEIIGREWGTSIWLLVCLGFAVLVEVSVFTCRLRKRITTRWLGSKVEIMALRWSRLTTLAFA